MAVVWPHHILLKLLNETNRTANNTTDQPARVAARHAAKCLVTAGLTWTIPCVAFPLRPLVPGVAPVVPSKCVQRPQKTTRPFT